MNDIKSDLESKIESTILCLNYPRSSLKVILNKSLNYLYPEKKIRMQMIV